MVTAHHPKRLASFFVTSSFHRFHFCSSYFSHRLSYQISSPPPTRTSSTVPPASVAFFLIESEERSCRSLSSPIESGILRRVDGPRRCRRFEAFSVLPQYVDCGDCTWVCEFCGAFFWYVERAVNLSTSAHLRYNHCCRGGSVVLPYPSRFPPYFVALYGWKRESFHSTTTLLLPLPMTNTKPCL
uniref:Uncharacterized protein n=1 Tax=Lactuca sativa TaxID=4236 RepID=A0A9R1XRY4_LACSA|nr:hypothetical protein LSAT_V11C300123790 [Lactuca sativa]